MKADLFIPCYIDQIRPDIALNVVRVLQQIGTEIHYPQQQTCCGQMAFNTGHWNEVKILGEKFLKEFTGEHHVVIPSASCAHMIRHHYHRFFYNTSMHLEYKKLQTKAVELCDFLYNVANVREWPGKLNLKVAYHPACSAVTDYGLDKEPVALLSMISGLEWVTINDFHQCCGFGGAFSVKFPELSSDMAVEKLSKVIESGANCLVTTESSCVLQLDSVAQKHQMPIRIATVADLLAESLRNSDAETVPKPE